MPRNYAALPYEYLEEMEELGDCEFGRLCRALLVYSMTGEETELLGRERLFAKRVFNRENRYKENFEHVCAVNKRKGAKGGRPFKNEQNVKTQSNTNTNPETNTETKTNTDLRHSPPTPSDEGERVSESENELFVKFWNVYPKKRKKEDAFKIWKELNPDETLCNRIVNAVERQRQTVDWMKDYGRYIPLPSNYLSGRRWEDEISVNTVSEPPSYEAGTVEEYNDLVRALERMNGTIFSEKPADIV